MRAFQRMIPKSFQMIERCGPVDQRDGRTDGQNVIVMA